MFSLSIQTASGSPTEIFATTAEDQYLADVVELLKVDTERRRCEVNALAQHRLFGEGEEVR